MTTTPRIRLFKVIVPAGTILLFVVLLILIESILRFVTPTYRLDLMRNSVAILHVYDEHLGWVLRPSQEVALAGVRYSTNANGYRGKPYSHERRPGTYRIVIIGDSQTFGFKVRDHESFAARLDERDSDLEVINLGVQGYGTDQALLMLERRGLEYSPDLVVYPICVANDPWENATARFLWDGVRPKPYFTVDPSTDELTLHSEHVRLNAVQRLSLYLDENSVLYEKIVSAFRASSKEELDKRVAANTLLRFPNGRELTRRELGRVLDGESGEQSRRDLLGLALPLLARLVAQMHDVSQAAGAQFLVVIPPYAPRDFRARGSTDVRWITEQLTALTVLESRGVEVLSLLHEFQDRGVSAENFRDYFQDYHCHLSSTGHQIVADAIARRLHAMAN